MAKIKLIAEIEGKGNFPVVDWTNVGAGEGFRLDAVINQAISTLNSKYTLPEGGIPLTDLANGVTSLINGKYSKPSSGIPMSDLSQAVQDAIAAGGGGGYVKPDDGIPASDMTSSVQASLAKADSALQSSDLSSYATKTEVNAKYSKPSSGIPASDLASSVQTSLGKADTAVQPSALNTYASKTELNAKYSKPTNGIPATDLTTAVQSSLNKADSALQSTALSSYSTTSEMNAAIASSTTDVESTISSVQSEIDSLSARMDEFTQLEEGSTTGDAELTDIRVGYDGAAYQNAGEAVRTQISTALKKSDNLINNVINTNLAEANWATSTAAAASSIAVSTTLVDGKALINDGTLSDNADSSVTDEFDVSGMSQIACTFARPTATTSVYIFLVFYDADHAMIGERKGGEVAKTGGTLEEDVPLGAKYARFGYTHTLSTVFTSRTVYQPTLILNSTTVPRLTTERFEITSGKITVECAEDYYFRLIFFASAGANSVNGKYRYVKSNEDDLATWSRSKKKVITVPRNAKGVSLSIRKFDNSELTANDVTRNVRMYFSEPQKTVDHVAENGLSVCSEVITNYTLEAGAIGSNGENADTTYDSNSCRTQYIDVSEFDAVDISFFKNVTQTDYMWIYFYDVNHEFLGNRVGGKDVKQYYSAVPSNAKYMRISFTYTQLIAILEKIKVRRKTQLTSDVKNNFELSGTEKTYTVTLEAGAISGTSGLPTSGAPHDTISCRSGFIQISNPLKINFSYTRDGEESSSPSSSNYYLYAFFYDSNQAFLGRVGDANIKEIEVTMFPVGTSYVRFSLTNTAIGKVLSHEMSGAEGTKMAIKVNQLTMTTGKRGLMMGDSITFGLWSYFDEQGHRYNADDIYTDINQTAAPDRISDWISRFYGIPVDNVGKRGTGWVADTRWGGAENALSKAQSIDFADYSYVILAFGINDYIQKVSIGSISESTEGTMIGNMVSVFEKIYGDNPLCKVIVCTPFNTWGQYRDSSGSSQVLYGDESTNYALGYVMSGGTKNLQDYIDAMIEVCEFYGVQYVECTKNSIVNRINIKNVLVDGLHPTQETMKFMASEIYKKSMFK